MMKKNFKSLLSAASVAALALSVVGAQARPTHWMDRDDDRIRNGEIVNLGEVFIGNSGHHYDADTLDLYGTPRLQCRLTHVKLTAFRDSVLITRIEVEYRDADRYGDYKDSIDLSDDHGPGHGHGRESGIYLDSGKSTGWLDVDDVVDGHADGRCIKSIRVYGIDTPDYGGGYGPGHGPGYGHGHGRPGHGHGGDNFRPARVSVDGLVGRAHHAEPPHHHPPHGYKYTYLGTTGLVQKLRPEYRTINVGRSQGRFDGIKLIAKDDAFEIKSIEIFFANGERVRRDNLQLFEGQDVYIDFDDYSHGHMDRDRFIDRVEIFGNASNVFGSKSQVEVWGGR